MTNLLERLSIDSNEVSDCPDCGAHAVHVSEELHSFSFGKIKTFTAVEPVWTCRECGSSFLDGRGGDIEEEVIRRFIAGRLNPRQIRGIRERVGLSRRELAKLTKFGEASIKRWETGSLIQNHFADRFLRLIDDDPSIIEKLRELEKRLAKK